MQDLQPLRLRVSLIQGSFFTIIPREPFQSRESAFVPRWYAGNIYDMERATPQTVDLPSRPDTGEILLYDIFIGADYEVRRFECVRQRKK